MYTELKVPLQEVLRCARGSYQRALLRGSEAWSGATLRGRAQSFGKHYKASRINLLDRLRRYFSVQRDTRAHGRIVFVIAEKGSNENNT